MSEETLTSAFTNDDLANAIAAHLWERGYGRIDVYNNMKIIVNDYGAHLFDDVLDETLNIILYGQEIDPKRLPAVKAMVESQHNVLVDIETAENDDGDFDIEDASPKPPSDKPTYMN